MLNDQIDLLLAFTTALVFKANHVKYVVIGGYAVFVHAQPRMTKDLDVLIESSHKQRATKKR